MDANFWHQKWAENKIGFHQQKPHPMLLAHFSALDLANGSRVFLPLCGKTRDIAWLLSKGYCVVGAELSKIAIEQLFQELDLVPKISSISNLERYSAPNIDIFVGDIFEVSRELLGPVDVTYDRAALVALPEGLRPRYTAHVVEITSAAPQLLVTFVYDQVLMAGPPFSVADTEVAALYSAQYEMVLLENVGTPGGLKLNGVARENVWLLTNR